jgi:hypothetical protein
MTDHVAHDWVEPQPPPPSWWDRNWKFLIAVGLAVAAAAVGLGLALGSTPEDEAREACRTYVRDRLVAPATAQFSEERVIGSNPTMVAGKVDSENRFGAMLRTTYTCRVQYESGEWRLVSLIGP